MSKFRNYQTNFSGGLLSEGMLGRLDLAQYENGCKVLTNWWPKITGGMRRRPGSIYLRADDEDTVHRIEAFVFNETQTYLFAFCDDGLGTNEIKVVDPDNGNIIDNVNLPVGWGATQFAEMSVTQTGDVFFMAHESYIPLMIRRTSATTFVRENFYFEGVGPTGKAYPLKAPGSGSFFEDRHVGRAIRYRGKQIYVDSLSFPAPTNQLIGVPQEELDQGATLNFAGAPTDNPMDFEIGEIIVGRTSGIKAEVVSQTPTTLTVAMLGGYFPPAATEQVEGLNSGNIATLTSTVTVAPVATEDWDEEAFSPFWGYPSVIEFHSQRLWLAGSSSLPAHIFGSRVAAFFNFDVGDAFPADSIQVVISSKQVKQIHDVVSGRHLQVFTDAGEFYAPQSEDRPLIPETFNLIEQTSYGTKRYIEPKVFDESTLYVQNQGNAIREFVWVDSLRGYSSDGISLIAEEHLNDVREVEVLYGGYDRPEQITFFVNGDGTITWYHAARAEGIRTWGKWTTQGTYKSVCVIADKLYALVNRGTVALGTNADYLERFELDVTLDCAVQSLNILKSVWTGDHSQLAGETVQVTTSVIGANHDPDYYLGEFEYAGATIDLTPIEVDNITVGFGFNQTLETMPIEVKDTQGVTGGLPKRLVNTDIYLASTLAVQIEGNRITTFVAGDDLTVKPTPVTGIRKFYLLGYDERPTLVVENEVPLPVEVLSLGAEVEY
jgi:hypothetical protein